YLCAENDCAAGCVEGEVCVVESASCARGSCVVPGQVGDLCLSEGEWSCSIIMPCASGLVCDGICVPAGEDGYRPALLDLVGGAVVVTPLDVDVAVTDSGSPVARGVSAGGTLDIAYASLSEVVVVHDA